MSLPLPVIDRLFMRLQITYGRNFLGQYEGQDAAAVKTSWCHELSGYSRNLQPLAWALENLPERVPNVIEFRALCRRAPAADVPALPEPQANPERVAAELAKLAPLRTATATSSFDHKAWAKRLRDADLAGHPVNANQARCYRLALGMEAA